jgi:branched-chain amino acid transport system ATP-binding protein
MTAKVLLRARGLVIRFGGVVAADGVDLDVIEGEHLAIIGPNGAGKTTFLNIATGYLRPQAGRVAFLERDITALAPRAITRLGIARAFQIPQLFLDHTVLECVLIAGAARAGWLATLRNLHDLPGRGAVMDLLGLVGLDDVADEKAIALPEGKRKLVDLAMALALEPKLVLLDEPTSGVAASEKFAVMDLVVAALDRQGVTSVFVEHDMDVVARYADRVAVWSAGRIQTLGPPAEVLKDPAVIGAVIGI